MLALFKQCFLLLLPLLVLSACSVFEPRDSAPPVLITADQVANAVPYREPITRAGNRSPYAVLGKTYHILKQVKGYSEVGIGSWYGTKFHGQKTANGEVYSLYKATAAHKTLPIPSFARVTNQENGREIIVRVNDRGPFHGDRIIDLSYAAAIKLGYANKGTALLKVEALDPDALATMHVDRRYFLQAGSFKNVSSAQQLRDKIQASTGQTTSVITSDKPGFYRVIVGPFIDYAKVEEVDQQLRATQLAIPRLITE